jgi:hypothetical protein
MLFDREIIDTGQHLLLRVSTSRQRENMVHDCSGL